MSVKIHTRKLDEQHVVIAESELRALVEAASQIHSVEVEETLDDLPVEGLMRLAESSGAFDFLLNEREDIHSVDNLKVSYW